MNNEFICATLKFQNCTDAAISTWCRGEVRVIWVIPFAPLISVVWNQLKFLQKGLYARGNFVRFLASGENKSGKSNISIESIMHEISMIRPFGLIE